MVLDHVPTPEELAEFKLISDLHKSHLTPFEGADGFCRAKAANPGVTQRALAAKLNIDETLLSKYLRIEDLGPEAYEAFKSGELTLTEMMRYAKATPQCQAEMLAKKRGVTNPAEPTQDGNRSEADEPGCKGKRLVCPVSNKAKVLITGQHGSLADVLNSHTLAIRKIEAAMRDGHSVASFATWLAMKPAEAPKKSGRKPKAAV